MDWSYNRGWSYIPVNAVCMQFYYKRPSHDEEDTFLGSAMLTIEDLLLGHLYDRHERHWAEHTHSSNARHSTEHQN